MNNEMKEKYETVKTKVGGKWKKLTFAGLLGLIASNSFLTTDAGYVYVYQNSLTGNLTVYKEPGIHPVMPFLSKITRYDEVFSISNGNSSGLESESLFAQKSLPPISVRFADTYTGEIPVSFRFRIGDNNEKILKMHKEFRSNANLIDSLLIKNARNTAVITATMMTGEEFFQGGVNSYKAKLEDQLDNGIYLTERRQVEVEQIELAPVGLGQNDSNKLQKAKQLVWKTVAVKGKNGVEIRQENPLDQYGIKLTQVSIGDPIPEPLLNKLLADKKELVAKRIKTVQAQETARAQAETEQLVKEIERTKAVQDKQRIKELAIIDQERAVEVAKQIAEREVIEVEKQKDIAVVNKERELETAKAELEIQKAVALSAEYQAKAILEKGAAEAKVLEAMYSAKGKNKEVYLAEINRDVATRLYDNLPNFKVEMPMNYINSGENNGGMTSNLDVITGLGAMGMMEKAAGLGK